jgi:integrase/recombinase XerC
MTDAPSNHAPTFRSLKLQDWPKIDQQLMAAALKPGGLRGHDGLASDWRPATLETVVHRNGTFLWWLGATGRLSPGSTPLERVTIENIEAFVDAYAAGHASTSVAVVAHGVYEATRVMCPGADLSRLYRVVKRLKRLAKPRPKLPRMVDHGPLMQLGEALIAYGAERVAEGHMLSAVAVRDGCLILFLVADPLRRFNLGGLRLRETLIRDAKGYRVDFPGEAMKTHDPYQAPLPDDLTPHLGFYVEAARPILLARSDKPDAGWFWLGAEGAPMTAKSLSRRVAQLTEEHFGKHMSAHLFRDASATAVALRDGANVGIVTSVLGHSTEKTAERYYNQARRFDAFRRYHDAVRRERRAARSQKND